MSDILNPSSSIWLTKSKKLFLTQRLVPISEFLKSAKILNFVVEKWITFEVIAEVSGSNNLVKSSLHLDKIDGLEELSEATESDQMILQWAKNQWQSNLKTIYLQRKDSLEHASFNMINLSSQNIASEIYNRILGDEETFDSLYQKYSNNTENRDGGIFNEFPLMNLPEKLRSLILKSQPGTILKPFKNGENYSIIIMKKLHNLEFNSDSHDLLLMNEFRIWKSAICLEIKNNFFS